MGTGAEGRTAPKTVPPNLQPEAPRIQTCDLLAKRQGNNPTQKKPPENANVAADKKLKKYTISSTKNPPKSPAKCCPKTPPFDFSDRLKQIGNFRTKKEPHGHIVKLKKDTGHNQAEVFCFAANRAAKRGFVSISLSVYPSKITL